MQVFILFCHIVLTAKPNTFRNVATTELISNLEAKLFFSIWIFFHEDSRITGLQGK